MTSEPKWVIVPEEPTPETIRAIAIAISGAPFTTKASIRKAEAAYRAMIAARPSHIPIDAAPPKGQADG